MFITGYKYAMTEMKTIIFHLLKAYKISTVSGFEEIVFSYKVSLRAKGGIRIFLKKRLWQIWSTCFGETEKSKDSVTHTIVYRMTGSLRTYFYPEMCQYIVRKSEVLSQYNY